jgi:AcrR family transcriptional regulator
MEEREGPGPDPGFGRDGQRPANTAERLRQAAREAFAELGWQTTRVEDIVRRAGVSHGTFYHYYENKAAVLADLVRASQSELTALAAAPWEGQDVRKELERVIGGLIDLYERDAPLFRTWLEAARDEPAFSALYREVRDLYVDRVAQNLAPVIAASARPHRPPANTLASALVAMVEHFAYAWLVLGEPHERDDAFDALVFVWGGALNAVAGFEIVRLR